MKKQLLFSFLLSWMCVSYANQPDLKEVSSRDCVACHNEIYKQWSQSMHANSTALKDPIHGAFYKSVIGNPLQEGLRKKGKYPVCLKCHAPLAAKDKKTDLLAKITYNEGVNCIACHTISAFKGTKNPKGGLQLGIDAYEYDTKTLQGSGNMTYEHPVFKLAANPSVLKSNAVCMGCHDRRTNSNKVLLCQTGSEIASSKGTTDCQLCHMPVVNGVSDHSMKGGHDAKIVSKGLGMMVKVSGSDAKYKAVVTLSNRLPHNFPTGAPFRNVYVVLSAFDADGKEIFKSSKSHPVKDDKKSMLMYALGDSNNKPVPPPKATQVLFDSRLKPHESRDIVYLINVSGVKKVEAKVFYDLLLPPIKKKFSTAIPSHLREPKLISSVSFEL